MFFAECNLAFAECLRHSAKNLNPVVPPVVEVEELAALGGESLRRTLPQLLERLDDRVEAGGVERVNDDGRPRQLFLRRDDEVQVPEVHVCAWDLADAVTSHSRPGVDVETHKRHLPGVPTVGVLSKHQRVNF